MQRTAPYRRAVWRMKNVGTSCLNQRQSFFIREFTELPRKRLKQLAENACPLLGQKHSAGFSRNMQKFHAILQCARPRFRSNGIQNRLHKDDSGSRNFLSKARQRMQQQFKGLLIP